MKEREAERERQRKIAKYSRLMQAVEDVITTYYDDFEAVEVLEDIQDRLLELLKKAVSEKLEAEEAEA